MRTERAVMKDGLTERGVGAPTFDRLYTEMLPLVYGYCRARLTEHDAEDVTAEVFRTALQQLRAEPETRLQRSWFVTTARNRIIDRWRHEARWRRRLVELAAMEPRPTEPVPDPGSDAVDMLDRLPSAQRAALLLHHVDGYTVAEVAEALGRSSRAVESLLARGRRRVHSELVLEGGSADVG